MADINIDTEEVDLYDDFLSPSLHESCILRENFLPAEYCGSTLREGGDAEATIDDYLADGNADENLAKENSFPSTSSRNNGKVGLGGSNEVNLHDVEFSFLDNKNICCGICGEIVPYESLMTEHLPLAHPSVFNGSCEQSLQKKLKADKRAIEAGFKMASYQSAARAPKRRPSSSTRFRRSQRVVSAIRVNPREMSLAQLDQALRKKMFEKLRRHVPVSLIDKLHARCGFCNAIISLNKKFEIVHLVRHFNCWHPTVHHCAGTWRRKKSGSDRGGASKFSPKPLTVQDFVVLDAGPNGSATDAVQCIWCGMFVEAMGLAQHFAEVHSDEVEVPQCQLCMHELIVNGRLQERYAADFEVTLPDEHHLKCGLCSATFTTEVSLERHLIRRHVEGAVSGNEGESETEDQPRPTDELGPEAFSNSRMIFGKRRRPKRQFIMPCLRHAVPLDSEFIEPVADCHWRCKTCGKDIYGAVISAAVIKHFKILHSDLLDGVQFDLCKARLERVSDGSMEFVNSMLIECLLCQQHFNLHQPFNMCRAIRHLKAKHPNLMPEYAGSAERDYQTPAATFDPPVAYVGPSDGFDPKATGPGPAAFPGYAGHAPAIAFYSPERGPPVFGQQQPGAVVDSDRRAFHQSAMRKDPASLDHGAAALPPEFEDLVEMDADGHLTDSFLAPSESDDRGPVYILVADEAQRQEIVQQVIAAGGKVQNA